MIFRDLMVVLNLRIQESTKYVEHSKFLSKNFKKYIKSNSVEFMSFYIDHLNLQILIHKLDILTVPN